jgi:hypothetical protein
MSHPYRLLPISPVPLPVLPGEFQDRGMKTANQFVIP